jgi:hypothetical protein
MKLIMENWKRFLNEERPVIDPRLLPALAQDAMEVVAANPGMDAASITLATMAKAGSELPLIDMEKVATITLGDLFDEVGLQNIMQGAAEFAADEAPPPGGGQWASPDISDEEDTLQEDADDDRDFEIEEATRDGEADGKSGSPRLGPGGHFQRYYDEAYDRASKDLKESSLPTWAQQLILQHPRQAAKIENYARNGYDRADVIRSLNLGYRSGSTGKKNQGRGGW